MTLIEQRGPSDLPWETGSILPPSPSLPWCPDEAAVLARKPPPKTPTLIGLTGMAGAGKDAVAGLLAMVGYRRRAFADEVRKEVLDHLLHQDPRKPAVFWLASTAWRLAGLLERVKPSDVWTKPTSADMRRILQLWGTEFRRTEDPEYWVKKVMTGIETCGPMVFSDVRFPNEAEAIRNRGGEIWKVVRPSVNGLPGETGDHISETSALGWDKLLMNSGTLCDLAMEVQAALTYKS
jgi:hypothetical protein